jgi:hypothetical protein
VFVFVAMADSAEACLSGWLARNGLSKLEAGFVKGGFVTLEECIEGDLTDADLKELSFRMKERKAVLASIAELENFAVPTIGKKPDYTANWASQAARLYLEQQQPTTTNQLANHSILILQNRSNNSARSICNSWPPAVWCNGAPPPRPPPRPLEGPVAQCIDLVSDSDEETMEGNIIPASIPSSAAVTSGPIPRNGNPKRQKIVRLTRPAAAAVETSLAWQEITDCTYITNAEFPANIREAAKAKSTRAKKILWHADDKALVGKFKIKDEVLRRRIKDGPGHFVKVARIDPDSMNPVAVAAKEAGFTEPVYAAIARLDIPGGTCLGEYSGQVITDDSNDPRLKATQSTRQTANWQYAGKAGLVQTLLVVCDRAKNELAYCNDYRTDVNNFKAKEKQTRPGPNIEVCEVELPEDGLPRLLYVTDRSIQKGEEILVDYGERFWEQYLENVSLEQQSKVRDEREQALRDEAQAAAEVAAEQARKAEVAVEDAERTKHANAELARKVELLEAQLAQGVGQQHKLSATANIGQLPQLAQGIGNIGNIGQLPQLPVGAAAGAGTRYRVPDAVEYYSQTLQCWQPGRVTRVEGSRVQVEAGRRVRTIDTARDMAGVLRPV